jgi:hypothetical protein
MLDRDDIFLFIEREKEQGWHLWQGRRGQRLPLLTLTQLTASQSWKRKAHESCHEDD